MKQKITLPTILGVLILVISMVVGIYLINSTQIFKISANTEAVPKNVRFSNLTTTSATISWTTDVESSGFIKWGNSEGSVSKVALEENANKSLVHSVNIVGASENTNIYLKINSEGTDYDNNGIVWQTKTLSPKAAISTPPTTTASGSILLQDTGKPVKSIVYLSINGTLISGITSDEGNFIIPISLYTDNLTDNTIIEIDVNAGAKGTSKAVIYPKAISAIPTIFIGKTYDFRSINVANSNDIPKSTLSIPESVAISSRFEVQKTESSNSNTSVTLDSINDGEIINTTDPNFFGKGPQNINLKVTIHSELQQADITTDQTGSWNWSPPANLTPGEHSLTIEWRDVNGVLRTLTRSFVVQASEGPAFESTPSATPLTTIAPTIAPTISPTTMPVTIATETPRVTPIVTAKPTPVTGDLTPTIGLFIMGIGVLLSSIFVWNKSNA